MTAAMRAQMKVIEQAAALEAEQPMLDLDHPDEDRRLTFDQSLALITERYREALTLLGKL